MTERLVDVTLSEPRVVAAKATAAPTILTKWRAAREGERKAAKAAGEMAHAMATFRKHGGQRLPRAIAAKPAPVAMAAFEVVDGQRSFGAGESDRLASGWTSVNTGINADLERALPTLRARSRDWAVNTDQGRRYISMVQDNVVGARAPRLQVRAKLRDGEDALDEVANTAIEQHWALWCERADITGRLNFDEICRTVAAATARDGEFLARRIRDSRLSYGYALQLLDVDRIYTGNGGMANAQGGNRVRLGVEINTLGQAEALHLYQAHPGDGQAGLAPPPIAQRVPMDQVFHGFVLERPEQVRGYPWGSAILKRANSLANFEGYALDAAKIGAAKMGFYVTDKDAPSGAAPDFDDYKDATGALIQEVEAGMLEALPPGTTFESFDPDYPHAFFGAFVSKFEHNIASGLNVAHHNLSGDMTGVNYSSARIAEMSERDNWRSKQLWFIHAFVRPVFEEWLRMALLARAITLPSGKALPAERFEKFRAASSFGPRGWRWVDPRNEMDAAATALANNLTSEQQIVEEQGGDLDEILTNRKRYRDRLRALGLPMPGEPATPAAPAPEPAAP